jgi:hypothetical protein
VSIRQHSKGERRLPSQGILGVVHPVRQRRATPSSSPSSRDNDIGCGGGRAAEESHPLDGALQVAFGKELTMTTVVVVVGVMAAGDNRKAVTV